LDVKNILAGSHIEKHWRRLLYLTKQEKSEKKDFGFWKGRGKCSRYYYPSLRSVSTLTK
jgi:hypothetical protein